MIEVKSLPQGITAIIAVDPGALGGWALLMQTPARAWDLVSCGLARTARGERPPRIVREFGQGLCCVGELPQYQKGDTPARINNLFTTSLRLGMLAEATGADSLWTRHPHDWKNSVDKKLHNARCLKRLTPAELGLLSCCTRADGTLVLESERNNVIDAIGLGLVTVGRW